MAIRFRETSLVCPCCRWQFDTKTVLGASPTVGKSSDFHDHYRVGESVLPHLIHFCEKCGFCAEEKNYAEFEDLAFQVAMQDFVESLLTPNLRWAFEYLADRYEHAYRIAEFADESPLYLADLALRGAWASVEERDHESERYFRRAAAYQYTSALQHFDMVDHRQRASITYLIGELWRRIGDRDLAELWFEAVPNAVIDETEQRWVVALADRQRNNPQDSL